MSMMVAPQPAAQKRFSLEHNAFGRLVYVNAQGVRFEGCVPVRAFPVTSPAEGVSLVGTDGRELLWIERLTDLDPAQREVIEAELALREFSPEILRIHKVSSYATPSVWFVDTDRGPTQLRLLGEEHIRRLQGSGLLIADAAGVQYRVRDMQALDRVSRRFLERFL